MNVWLDWGLPIILWLQGLGTGILQPMLWISFLGTEFFYLLILPAILWLYNVRLGVSVGMILLTSASINSALKQLFSLPRPYWTKPQVTGYAVETSFGAPSGHAQNAVAFWGRIAAGIGSTWAYIAAIVLTLLISISRPYLGVHWPTDVIIGWIVGGLILWAFLRFEGPVSRWLNSKSLAGQIGAALAYSLILLAINVVIFLVRRQPIPESWPIPVGLNPYSLRSAFGNTGAVFGLGAGAALLFSWGKFTISKTWWKLIVSYVLGLVGVAILFFGLDVVFPGGNDPLSLALRYLRFTAVGFYVSFIAPWLFVTLRLTDVSPTTQAPREEPPS